MPSRIHEWGSKDDDTFSERLLTLLIKMSVRIFSLFDARNVKVHLQIPQSAPPAAPAPPVARGPETSVRKKWVGPSPWRKEKVND